MPFTPSHPNLYPFLRHVLVRLVRIAIGCGINFQAFTNVLRSVYWEVGIEYEPVKGKPNSDSRVSLLTGLSRRDVRQLRQQAPQHFAAPTVSPERLVMDAWSSNLDLIDADGNLLPLARTARQGGQRSFEALVESLGTDMRPRALLDEWLRKGFVILDEQDRVAIANQRPIHGMQGIVGSGHLVGELVSDLLEGFERTYLLGRPMPGYSYHVVYGHRLTEESVHMVCSAALREGTLIANKLNRLIVERETIDSKLPQAVHRVSFGFGVFQTEGQVDPGLLDPSK